MPVENIPDEKVTVKISICGLCNGIVRSAVEHMMDRKSKNSFAKEVMDNNLSVKQISLIEYRKTNLKWCTCK